MLYLSIDKLSLKPKSSRIHKKLRKKERNEKKRNTRNEMKQALENQFVPRNDTIHLLKCNKERFHKIFPDVATGCVLSRKVFLLISQISQENTYVGVSF